MATWPPDGYKPADVYIGTIDELLRWAPEAECKTVYVARDAATHNPERADWADWLGETMFS